MTSTSFDRLLKSSRLATPAVGRADQFIADHSIRMTRADRERLEGKVKKARGSGGGSGQAGKFAKKLSQRVKTKAPRSAKHGRATFHGADATFDARQRAVVKTHYFNHGNGGAAGLKAHAKYVARDAAARDDLSVATANDKQERVEDREDARQQARAHAAYLDRREARPFYDAQHDGVDGATRVEAWAKSDLRHFRVILSAEEGTRLRDLPTYTREVMARAGASLGTTLSWVAVDHHDTDNVHTHLIIRGRRANGQDLVMPKEFIKHGFRSIARDVATEWLGRRTPEDERLALNREVRRHAPTRLDRMIEAQARPEGRVRIAELRAPNGDATLTQALRGRMRELERLGLAHDLGGDVFKLAPDWRDRLQSLELHLNVRKRIVMERTMQDRARQLQQLRKGLLER